MGLFTADENAGVHGLAAVCAALYYREKTGVGQSIDLSLLECMFHLHDTAIQFYVMSDGHLNPNRFGSHHYLLAPRGIFKASDGYVVITVLDHQWETFCTAIGRREWLDDPRFATREARVDNRLALDSIEKPVRSRLSKVYRFVRFTRRDWPANDSLDFLPDGARLVRPSSVYRDPRYDPRPIRPSAS